MTEDAEMGELAELKADNRRLRRLLDQRDAPGELRHRLRGTLAIMRAIIRKTASTQRTLEAYVAHLEDRLDAVGRAQSAADENGGIELHRLLSEELFHYGLAEDDRVNLHGPSICFRARPGQILTLAFHELVVNAVEHSSIGAGEGALRVDWTLDRSCEPPVLDIHWTEHSEPLAPPGPAGFGTEMLTRTLAYDLSAAADLRFEPEGFRCRLHLPLPDAVGFET